MSEKRISELVKLPAGSIQGTDLMVINDVSALETKKIAIDDIISYMGASGSFIATTAATALTASYINPVNVGLIPSSSFSISSSHVIISDTSFNSTSASFLIYSNANGSASYAVSCSYALVVTSLSSASYATSASHALVAKSSSFLVYTGVYNGTSSYGVNSLSSSYSTLSDTASYFNSSIGNVSTASHAGFAKSSSYLNYDGVKPTGTASYAVIAATSLLANTASLATELDGYMPFGPRGKNPFSGSQLNSSASQHIEIVPGGTTAKDTFIQAWGDMWYPIVNAMPDKPASLSLHLYDYAASTTTSLDRIVPVMVGIVTPTASVYAPFNLMGTASLALSGSYTVVVSGSDLRSISTPEHWVTLSPYRPINFVITTKSRRVNFTIPIV